MRAVHLTLILAGATVAAGAAYLVVELRGADATATPTAGPAGATPNPHQPHQARSAQERRPASPASVSRRSDPTTGHGAASPRPRPMSSGAETAGPGEQAPFTIPRIAATSRPIIALRDTAATQGRHPASLGPHERHAGDATLDALEDALARADFTSARDEGLRILGRDPAAHPRALQIVVEATCGLGEAESAAKLATRLTGGDLAAVRARCASHGVTLP